VDAILAGQPYRDIEAWAVPAVTRGSLSRFKLAALANTRAAITAAKTAIAINDTGLAPAVTNGVTKAVLAAAADPFIGEIFERKARRERWIHAAEGKLADPASTVDPDHKALAAHDRNGGQDLELHARFANRLDSGGPNIAIQIVCPAPELPDEPAGDVIDILPGK
jgi:hypothetical protein